MPTVVFRGGTIDPLTLDDDGIGKGERGESEFVPVDLRDDVMLALWLGVMLGGTVMEEFEDGIGLLIVPTETVEFEEGIGLLTLPTGVEDDGIGNGLRGESELVPVDRLETGAVGKTIVEFADGVGGIIPPPPVPDEVYVLLAIVMLMIPPVVETTISGVGESVVVVVLVLTFADGSGGMIPFPPVENAVPVEKAVVVVKPVERISIPDETETLGNIPPDELGGGISPETPVDKKTPVELLTETISIPEDVVTVMFTTVVGVGRAMLELFDDGEGTPVEIAGGVVELVRGNGLRGASELVPVEPIDEGEGGMIPLPPVEFAVKVLLAVVRVVLPKETVSTIVTIETFGVELGGISPLPPPLIVVAVEP
jgi:hypothetical protein